MDNEVKDWWEKCHNENNIALISGSPSERVWASLQVTHLISKGKKVLNIGIGTGTCTRSLVNSGCVVDVLDISEKAIDKVKDIINKSYKPDSLDTIEKNNYDLIISHLVMQHMSDEDVNYQLKRIIPSLKGSEYAKFAFQFASYCDHGGVGPAVDENGTPIQTTYDQQYGGVCRSLEYMRDMVHQNNGKVSFEKEIDFTFSSTRWGFFHVVGADFK